MLEGSDIANPPPVSAIPEIPSGGRRGGGGEMKGCAKLHSTAIFRASGETAQGQSDKSSS